MRIDVKTATRAELLAYAVWNDPNGEWVQIQRYDAARREPCTCDACIGPCNVCRILNQDYDVSTEDIREEVAEMLSDE